MAEADQKPLSLAEQWSLQDGGKQSDQSEIPVKEKTENGKPSDATSEEVVPENADEIPVADDGTPFAEENNEVDGVISVKEITENGVSADTTSKEAVEIPVADDGSPVAEENNEAPEEEETAVQEDAEEKLEIKLETAPADFRFPTTNQTRHCFTRYIEYHRCIAAKGEGASECDKFAKYYRSLCPSEWVERWNEQRENGTFPGPL